MDTTTEQPPQAETTITEPTMFLHDWYAYLGIPRDASRDVVVNAFSAQLFAANPDRYRHMGAVFKAAAAQHLDLVSRAMKALRVPSVRAQYDAKLAAWTGPISSNGVRPSYDDPAFFDYRFADAEGRAMTEKSFGSAEGVITLTADEQALIARSDRPADEAERTARTQALLREYGMLTQTLCKQLHLMGRFFNADTMPWRHCGAYNIERVVEQLIHRDREQLQREFALRLVAAESAGKRLGSTTLDLHNIQDLLAMQLERFDAQAADATATVTNMHLNINQRIDLAAFEGLPKSGWPPVLLECAYANSKAWVLIQPERGQLRDMFLFDCAWQSKEEAEEFVGIRVTVKMQAGFDEPDVASHVINLFMARKEAADDAKRQRRKAKERKQARA